MWRLGRVRVCIARIMLRACEKIHQSVWRVGTVSSGIDYWDFGWHIT